MQTAVLSRVPWVAASRSLVVFGQHKRTMALRNETLEQRASRKEQIKLQKADKRARREGHIPDDYGQKPCTLCKQQKDLLIRCQIDKTETWHMVCGKCWKTVSGGVVDGDAQHPEYRYGGLWKNLHKADKVPEPSHKDDIQAENLHNLETHTVNQEHRQDG